MKNYIFTDLACECGGDGEIRREYIFEGIQRQRSFKAEGERRWHYVTFFTPALWGLEPEKYDALKQAISEELRLFISEELLNKKDLSILAVGLGNPRLTPDSLGAQTVEKLRVTSPDKGSGRRLMAVCTDVSGNTGIQTVDAVRAYVDMIKPDAIIAVDSLRAREYGRLASTVQLSDRGIAPGSGVGISRAVLSCDTLGIPVVAIGVPTVISAATLVCDAVEMCGGNIDDRALERMIGRGIDPFVMPKEADVLVKSAAYLLSDAINCIL